jgi:putative tricarboxylic transport membrane protein
MLSGLITNLMPSNLIALFFGTFIGIIFGAIPGLGSSIAIILVLPLTYYIDITTTLILLISIYNASSYAGSIPAILLNIPGTAPACMTTLDGFPLAQKGLAGEALSVSAISSGIGGIIGGLALLLVLPSLSRIALSFGPAEYFALTVFGMSVITSVGTENQVKAILSMFLGFFFATVGATSIWGGERFTFGNQYLITGFKLVPVLIGLFAVSEIFMQSQKRIAQDKNKILKVSIKLPPIKILIGLWDTWIRSSFIGIVVGILPGLGATIAAVLAYNEQRRWMKKGKILGTGVYEGIAAPEAGNNAVTGAAMIPTLALGIPGSPSTAVLMGAFLIQGIFPGPKFVIDRPDLLGTLFVCIVLSGFLIFLFGLFGVRFIAPIMQIPNTIIYPIISLFCIWGAFSASNDSYDILVVLIFGIIGFFMKKYGFSTVAMILGIIIGPISEPALEQTLALYKYDYSELLNHPIAIIFLLLAIITLLYPSIHKLYKKKKMLGEINQ